MVIALNFKGIPYKTERVDPADRTNVIASSGQELTPAIEDRGVKLNDSEAILQYLDANYTDSPRLFPKDRANRKRCEDWHNRLNAEIGRHWLPPFLFAIKRVEELDATALAAFHGSLANFEQELSLRGHFAEGPDDAICDLRMAMWLAYAMPGEALIQRVGLFKRFAEVFAVEPGRYPKLEKFLEPWHPLM